MRRKGCRNTSILAVLVGAVVLVSGCVSEYTKFPWASNDQTGTEDLGGDWAEGDGRLDALDLVDDPRIPDVPPDAPDVEDVWELLDVPDTLDVPDVPDVPDVEDVDGWEQIDPWCGDGTCDEGENCESCADDCGPCCGNGLCDHEETACACPADCGDPCEGRECGDDGCGGVCGLCGDGLFCSEGFLCLMEDGPTTCAELDACFRDCEEGDAVCAQLCRKSAPAPALVLWDDLVLCAGAECVLDPAEECIEAALLGPCVTEYEACFEICVPKCHGRECGSDLCGANCGYCQPFFVCEEGTCVADPGCGDAVCGAEETCDTCPLDCGECCGDGLCDLLLETCATCPVDCGCALCGEECVQGMCTFTACDGKECGPDGCGAACGVCPEFHVCLEGTCEYSAECGNAICDPQETCLSCPVDCGECCGNDVCEPDFGENCSLCAADCACTECGETCETGSCVFTACVGKVCGDDGCGSECGTCNEHFECDGNGQCVYVPWCGDATCDPGENCEVCAADCGCVGCGEQCVEGECQFVNCAGRECGDDGCAGTCGTCQEHFECSEQGLCVYVPWCGDTHCDPDENCESCPEDCGCTLCGEECQVGECQFTACVGKECGSDGCGGTCGQCEEHHECGEAGLCEYVPWCGDGTCDSGEDCESCDADCGCVSCGEECRAGQCLFIACEGRECGDDGCEGSCGECAVGGVCVDGSCCFPDCDGKQCGPDGCGQNCGTCDEHYECGTDGQCVYVPWCGDGTCDPDENCDSCGADCGCTLCGEECRNRICVFAACEGRECGDDGCGDVCGTCLEHHECSADGLCVYVPWCGDATCDPDEDCDTCPVDCACQGCGEECQGGSCTFTACEGKACGDDGCGGVCGECEAGSVCIAGACCAPACEGKECGDDGCGGVCGVCADHHECSVLGLCVYVPWCGDGTCDSDENCSTCPADCGDCCGNGTCEPQFAEDCFSCTLDCGCACGHSCLAGLCEYTACDGKECGSDGCGGSCGTCADSYVCVNGQCEYSAECGNAICDTDESCASCPADCGECCGNGVCDEAFGEGCSDCPEDCGFCLGVSCGDSATCQSGHCVDGVCCNGACEGSCRACNLSGSLGTCTYRSANTDPEAECGLCRACNGFGNCDDVAEGTDPLNQCAQTLQRDCGADGQCDGAGSCRLWSSSTVCKAQSCVINTLHPADYCDGLGNCVDSGTESCGFYVCLGDTCGLGCSSDSHCASAYYCHEGSCVTKRENGSSCTADNVCTSGRCVDDYCCNSACDGTCESCGLGGTQGICTPYSGNTDPEDECGLCAVCNGAGGCAVVPDGEDPLGHCPWTTPYGCGLDGSCDGTGECRLWNSTTECADSSCVGSTLSLADYCDGAGTCVDSGASLCNPYLCSIADPPACATGCGSSAQCVSGFYCDDAGTCVEQKSSGDPCAGSDQCLSGFCVDGFCCQAACSGTCMSCGIPGLEGFCTLFGASSDPEGECGLCRACNGAGGCVNVSNGKDPLDHCEMEPKESCGLDGQCNGSGACRWWGSTTQCSVRECVDSTLFPVDYCDGFGTCVDSEFLACDPYRCAGDVCRTACTSDTHCIATHFCKSQACVPRWENGEPCSAPNQCLSGFCTDGVCCNVACDAPCRSCNLDKPGICTMHGSWTDPEGECGTCRACSGSGGCQSVSAGQDPLNHCAAEEPDTCGLDGQCDGNAACRFYPGTVKCGDRSCLGSIFDPYDYCDGKGECLMTAPVSCCPYRCNGPVCGASCSHDSQVCTGNLCVTGKTAKSCVTGGACGGQNGWCCGGNQCGDIVVLQMGGTSTPTIRNSSTFGADNHFDYSGTGTDSQSPDRVFQLKGTSSAILPGTSLSIKVAGDFDTYLFVGTGACGDMSAIVASNDDGCGLPNGGSCVTLPVPTISMAYYIYVEGASQFDVGDFSIELGLVEGP